MIPYGRQDISADDIAAVLAVLQSDFLTQGPAIERFERVVADYCGAKYAVAVANATAALHIACLAADLGPGDRLWTVPNTFVASANCGRYCGAVVDFVDIDADTLNLSVAALRQKLLAAKATGTLPKVLVPVDFAGRSCEMAELRQLADEYGFVLLEDASHAIGARYQGRPVGSCAFSDMTVFSFHPVKIVTTGEGGMVLTNDAVLYRRLLRLRSHGITRDSADMLQPEVGGWVYQQLELGFNYRITDIQAALGASQMTRLDHFVEQRQQKVQRYLQLLADLPLILPALPCAENRSAWHLFPVQIDAQCSAHDRRQVFDALRSRGIGVNVHYIPVHTQPYYRQLGFDWGQFPVAEQYYRQALSLPLYPGLSEAQQDQVVQALQEVLS